MADKPLTDFSCGVIPVWLSPEGPRFLLVQHHAGHWAFPKGHPEGDETPLDTARRELAEETGLSDVELWDAPAFEERYCFTKRSGRAVEKLVTYYLGRVTAAADAVVIQAEEVQAYAWGDRDQTVQRLTFAEGRALFDEVCAYLDTHPEVFGL
ncbi:MAG: NUDIX domain-containing protein [Planctomycetota bacterium]